MSTTVVKAVKDKADQKGWTVAELIETLKQYPQNDGVFLYNHATEESYMLQLVGQVAAVADPTRTMIVLGANFDSYLQSLQSADTTR